MLTYRYRIGSGAKRRLLDDIIDNSVVRVNNGQKAHVIFTTRLPHKLLTGDHCVIVSNETEYRLPVVKINDKQFQIDFPLLLKLDVVNIIYEKKGSGVKIAIRQPVTVRKSIEDEFVLYDYSGGVLFEDCFFDRGHNGEIFLDKIVVPDKYYTGLSFMDDYPDICIGRTDLIDWDNDKVANLTIYAEPEHLDFSLIMESNQSYKLDIEEMRGKLLEDEIKKVVIPPSVDMEKQVFEPVFNDFSTRIKTIKYKLHFRDRMTRGKINDGWSVTEGGYWNPDAYTTNSDALKYLGFTTDDVKYQHKRLRKSFLRLLYYDSNDPATQNLLAYSTIFFDTNTMYSQYVKNVVHSGNRNYKIETDTNNSRRIDTTITVEDKYNNNASSEGFYTYLYPNIVSGNTPKTIYMKVEFNHAGYGKTVQLAMPSKDDGTPLNIQDSGFPKGYMYTTSDGSIETDILSYIKNLYIEIKVKYDEETGRYMYCFPWLSHKDNDENREITLTLYEPRVNGFNK